MRTTPPLNTEGAGDGDELTPKERRLSHAIIERLLGDAVAAGRLDPNRLDDPSYLPEVQRALEEITSPEGRIVFSRAGTLLQKARAYARAQDWDFACLLYATWAEHWVNYVLQRLIIRAFRKDTYFKSIVRTTTLEAKLTWLPVVLGAPPIHQRHQVAVRRLAEARNEFIHFKWSDYPFNSADPLAAKAELVVRPFQKSVRYLQRWETLLFLSSGKPRVRSFIEKLR